MKRRQFLKLLGIAPIAPGLLAAKKASVPLPKVPEKIVDMPDDMRLYFGDDYILEWDDHLLHTYVHYQFICSQPNTHVTLTNTC